MEESQKLNKARVEEHEKLVDKQSDDAPTRDKGTNNSNENNTNTNGTDNNGNNRKHKHQVQTIIPKKDKGNENPFAKVDYRQVKERLQKLFYNQFQQNPKLHQLSSKVQISHYIQKMLNSHLQN